MLLARRLTLLLLAAPALARADEAVWVLERLGKEVGREVARVEELEGGAHAHASTIDVNLTGEPWHAEQRLELDAQDAPRAYQLTSGTHELRLSRAEGGLRLEGTVLGNPVQRALPTRERVELLLDNLAWSHYDVLGRAVVRELGLQATPAAVGSLDVGLIVPQAAQALRGRIALQPGALQVRHGDELRAARRAELTVAALLVNVVFDASDGRAYRVEVPAQGLLARREGWSLVEGPLPTPAAPGSAATWREREVTIDGPRGAIGGTLCVPLGEGRHPAALLVAGSGPQDRDETIGPNKPLQELARALAARGVASLRCDKRTWVLRQEMQAAASADERHKLLAEQLNLGLEEEYLADARAALAWLRQRDEVDPRGLLVIGHSLGALVAPELARAGQAAGVVLLAGPGRPMVTLLEEQLTYQATLAGKPAEQAQAEARAALEGLRQALPGQARPEQVVLGATLHYWRDVHARDLPALLRDLPLPVLALGGAEDCQVRPADLEAIRAALAARQGPPGQARLLPGHNHLFQVVDGPSTGAEYFRPRPLDPAVAEAIAGWWREVAPRGE